MFLSSSIPHTIFAGSIGIPDTMLLMLLALMVFGPRRLPEIGRQIGKLMYEFRKISNDFKFQMEEELRISEEIERQRQVSAATAVAEIPHLPPPEPVFATDTYTVESPSVSLPPQESSTAVPEPFQPEPSQPEPSQPETSRPSSAPLSVPASDTGFPTIQPPTQGGVVPRAFRGLIPATPATTAQAEPATEPPTDTAATSESVTTHIQNLPQNLHPDQPQEQHG